MLRWRAGRGRSRPSDPQEEELRRRAAGARQLPADHHLQPPLAARNLQPPLAGHHLQPPLAGHHLQPPLAALDLRPEPLRLPDSRDLAVPR